MIIKSINVKNFYSFKDISLDLTKYNGIVNIVGNNKDSGGTNASGKSSLLESFIWGIYGRTVRKSTEDSLVNNIEGKGCSVEINLHKDGVGDITIIRCKRPTSLNVFVNGEAITQESAQETQSKLEALLDTNYQSFVASVVFGQHAEIDFLSATPDTKRVIIKNCLNLDEVFSKREIIKEIKSNFYTSAKVSDSIIQDTLTEMKSIKSKLESIVGVVLPTEQELETQIADHKKLTEKIKDLKDEGAYYSKEISLLLPQINEGVYTRIDPCPTCKQKYTKKQTKTKLKALKSRANKLNKLRTSLDKKIMLLEDLRLAVTPKYSLPEFIRLTKINESVQTYKTQMLNLESKLKKETDASNHSKKMYEVLKFWETAYSEKGLVKYIVRNILDYLNYKVNEYASLLTNNSFKVVFNEELNETIINNGRKVYYNSLSGGERKRLNLAIMLSLGQIQSKISRSQSNILFLDEVSDSLDREGVFLVHSLLTSMKDSGKIIFIITHNDYLKSLLGDERVLIVEKKGGISNLIESAT